MYTDKKDKAAAILSYFSWIGWVIAFIIRNKEDQLSRLHLNQGFILAIAGSVTHALSRFHGLFGLVGDILSVFVLILAIVGIVRAVKGSDEPLPFVGDIRLI